MPVMYAFRYGIYIDPNISPAPSAAAIPCSAFPCAACEVEAVEIRIAPENMITPPPTTPSFRDQEARCNSLNNTTPHKIPIKLFAFQSGNARLRPMSFTAKIVSVLPVAQRQPAMTPQTTRWGAWRISVKVSEVLRINAGRLQREMNAPSTIMNEITSGDTATVTNLVGASAPASHNAADTPQKIPSRCSFRWRDGPLSISIAGRVIGQRTAVSIL